MVSVVTSPFSFLIFLIWFFPLFFLMCLASGLSILFIFSKNYVLVLLIFAIVSFTTFSLISALFYFFPPADFGVFCSSFPRCFRYRDRLSIQLLSCFSRCDFITINFPLRSAFAESHCSGVVMFPLSFVSRNPLISLISPVTSSLISNVLFNLHEFDFCRFLPNSWYLVS